jgi:hypothetical protein
MRCYVVVTRVCFSHRIKEVCIRTHSNRDKIQTRNVTTLSSRKNVKVSAVGWKLVTAS